MLYINEKEKKKKKENPNFKHITRVNTKMHSSIYLFIDHSINVIVFCKYITNLKSILLMDLSELIFRFTVTYYYIHHHRIMSATMNNEWTTHANSYRPKTIENEVWYMSIQTFWYRHLWLAQYIYMYMCVGGECHCGEHYRIGQNIVHACHCNSWT